HCVLFPALSLSVFFSLQPAPPETFSLSLHDALPIFARGSEMSFSQATMVLSLTPSRLARSFWLSPAPSRAAASRSPKVARSSEKDRKSTRLNSSHVKTSYAVFCLKKKRKGDPSCSRC